MNPAPDYSTGHVMTTCGADVNATQAEILSFGFIASGLFIFNTCSDKLYYSLSEKAPSTGSAFIAGCSAIQIDGSIRTGGIGLLTTSTTTAGGAIARPLIAVTAWSA